MQKTHTLPSYNIDRILKKITYRNAILNDVISVTTKSYFRIIFIDRATGKAYCTYEEAKFRIYFYNLNNAISKKEVSLRHQNKYT